MSSSLLPRRVERAVRLALVIAVTTGTTACGAVRDFVALDPPADRVSVKGYELDLAYGEEPVEEEIPDLPALVPLAPVPMAELAVEVFDLPPVEAEAPFSPRRITALPPPQEACPEPGPGVVAERPITPDVKVMVEPGSYLFKQVGTVELVGLATYPLPELTMRIVRNLTGTEAEFDFDVELFTGTRRQVQRYRVVQGDGIFLRGVDTTVNAETIAFNPVTPVEVFPLPASENTAITSAGVDPLTGQTMVVQGLVTKKERVLGCDEVVDGWVVDAQWSFSRPTLSGMDSRTYEYDYTVATQHGGLIVADHLATVTPENYGPFVANVDVTSAIGKLTPKPEPQP